MLSFLRRLWSWIRQHLLGKLPQVEAAVAAPEPQRGNLDYEGCLFALIDEVEAGGSWANLQVILILRRISVAQLADWLSAFSERWLAEAEAYQELAEQLRQLGKMAASPLGAVAVTVGHQLQIIVSEDTASLKLGKDTELQQIVEQIQAEVNEQNFEDAVVIAGRYVQRRPQEAEAWHLQGDMLKILDRHELAIESYEQAIALKLDYASAWNSRGSSLRKLGLYELAIESYDQAIALKLDYANAWNNRGNSLGELGRYELAVENYDQAIALKPNHADTWHNRGTALHHLGRCELAIESFDQVIVLKPDDASAWDNRGLALHHLGHYELAIENYDQAIALKPGDASACQGRGNSLGNLGRYELAIESFDQAIALKPDNASAWDNRGLALHHLGCYEPAIESFDQAIALKPDYATAWDNRGNSLASLCRYEPAIESFDQAITLKPDYASAWNNRGKALGNLGRYELAIESFDQAIALKPNDAIVWDNRGDLLHYLGHHELAMKSYNQAITLKPDDASAWQGRGIALRNLGRYELALESYDQAIMLKPDDARVWHNRGLALCHLGRYELALESCDQAIALKPDYALAWNNRGQAAHRSKDEGTISSLQSQFVPNLRLSLAKSKQQLLRSWQPPSQYALTQSLEQSIATSAPRLKERFPQLADTFSSSLSPALQKFLQRPSNLKSVHAVLRQPITETLIQWLEQNEQKHPHHANPDLNQRGYQGAIASYRAPLDKAIRKDTHPEGWAKLHQAIGKAHLQEAKLRANPRSLWRQAENSFKTALSAPDLAAKSPTFYLNLLESLIDLCIRLGEQQTAQELQRQGHDLITRLLNDDNLSTTQKQSFAFTASRFDQLSVDSLIQQNKLSEALTTAETGKKLCLRWLLQLDEIPPVDLDQLQLGPNQAAIYWHLSPSRLTTFLLLPGETSPYLIPAIFPTDDPSSDRPDWLQQQIAWEDWLQQWNRDYSDYSRLNKGTPKESHPWRQNMTQRLDQLSNLLNIDAIQAELSKTKVSELLLIPHRDLHRFPLHGFFVDYTCRYLPHLPLQAATDSTESLPLAPLLIVENPKHEGSTKSKGSKGLADLPFVELEAECLRQLVAPQTCNTLDKDNATKAQIQSTLAGDYRLLHFSGHGIYDASVPAQSCLFLSGGDRLTLIDIVQQDFRHLELVTLAACETAITGNETITDEYIGLVSAFLSAGARYVLSTLWRVESEASMVLIVEFYRNLSQPMPPAVALKQAQSFLAHANRQTMHNWFTDALTLVPNPALQELIRDRQDEFAQPGPEHPFSHPYFWSPFTLTSL